MRAMKDNPPVNIEDEFAKAFAEMRALTAPEMRRIKEGVRVETAILDDMLSELEVKFRQLGAEAATDAVRQQVVATARLAAQAVNSGVVFGTLRSGYLNPYLRDKAKSEFDNKHAEEMRNARANLPEEIALLKAIAAERGNGPVERSWKEANAIHDEVNRRLESEGHKPVNVDKIRRRLVGKSPRS
jgi:succinate dehydrogenase/fumarate reductase flavoprotein subunit